jgi:protein TonB
VGTSALGTTLAGLGDPSFTYDYYVERMLTAIEANWRRPSVTARLETVLFFRISREGRISGLTVMAASGNNGFDLAALRAVQNADPLPPLPAKYRKDSLEVTLIVR